MQPTQASTERATVEALNRADVALFDVEMAEERLRRLQRQMATVTATAPWTTDRCHRAMPGCHTCPTGRRCTRDSNGVWAVDGADDQVAQRQTAAVRGGVDTPPGSRGRGSAAPAWAGRVEPYH